MAGMVGRAAPNRCADMLQHAVLHSDSRQGALSVSSCLTADAIPLRRLTRRLPPSATVCHRPAQHVQHRSDLRWPYAVEAIGRSSRPAAL